MLYILVILFLLWFFFKVFGKYILAFVVKFILNKAVTRAGFNQQPPGKNPQEDQIIVDDNIKVSVPKNQKPKPKNPPSNFQDVDFEEIK